MFFKKKNLLPRVVFDREALPQKLPKIKSGFPRRFRRLAIISLVIFVLSGYYPTFSIPPVKKATVKAQVQEQKGEVVAASFAKPLVLPHPGYLSTRYSPWHPGIDIAAGLGMPVHPITDGEVSFVGRDLFGLGNYIEVTHQNGFKSKYAHMGKMYVKIGQKITSENTLGEVGLTGNTSGPHTHLEVTFNGKYIDPLPLLPEISTMPVTFAVRK